VKKVFLFILVFVACSGKAQMIATLEKGNQKPLLDPFKAFWTLKNDKTERPGIGETESEILKDQNRVIMKGLLASLPSPTLKRVGFSLMETAITKPIQRSEGILFEMKGTEGLWVSVLVKDRHAETSQGTLTFQWDFELNSEKQIYTALWKDFVATIRGKKVAGYDLDLFSVTHLSFQVSRSKQQKWQEEVPLSFEIEL